MTKVGISVWLMLSVWGLPFALGQASNAGTTQLEAVPSHDLDVSDCLRYKPEFVPDYRNDVVSTTVIRSTFNTEEEYEKALYQKAMYPILREHARYDYMLYWKYMYGYIFHGEPQPRRNPFELSSNQLDIYLQSVLSGNKPAGILVYWRSESKRLCVGLVLENKRMLVEPAATASEPIPDLLRLSDTVDPRFGRLRNAGSPSDVGRGVTVVDDQPSDLRRLAEILLPGTIAQSLEARRVRSLLVVPIENLGRQPYAALPINADGDPLIDYVSLTVAPSFLPYAPDGGGRPSFGVWKHSLVVGDPDLSHDPKWIFPDLPGARQEAKDVASLVGVSPLIGSAATHFAVVTALRRPSGLDLIYFASHAVSDPVNPQDASFVALTGADLYTREVEKIKLSGKPLVILSACQTGLGKEFNGGIFGMALAWYYSGANAVIMSLWNVSDDATHDLMLGFMRRVGTMSPDMALAETMRNQRKSHPNYRDWASFVVYGALPIQPPSHSKSSNPPPAPPHKTNSR